MTRGLLLSLMGLLMTAGVADLHAADAKKQDRKPIGSNDGSANINRTPTLPRRAITSPSNSQQPDAKLRSLNGQNQNSFGNNNKNKLDWSYPRSFTPRKGNSDNTNNNQPQVIKKDLPKNNINNNPGNHPNSGGFDFKHNAGHESNVKPFIEVNPAIKGTSRQDWVRRQNHRDSDHIRRGLDWNNKGFNGRLDRHWSADDRKHLAHDVRSRMRPYSYFRQDWRPYNHHWHGDDHWRHYWTWNGWRPYYWWRRPTWTFFTGWYGPSWGTYIPYDYGDTIYYQNNYVYMNGRQVAPADVYAQQAINLASVEVPAPPELPADATDPIGQWQPLGAFALVSRPNEDPNTFLQIAVSKEGFIAGTYYDRNSEDLLPIQGSIDRRTQRAAWRVGEDKETVMEAGIYNLTQDQAPLLIHFGPNRTENYLLVRMEQPRQGENSGSPSYFEESR